MRTRAFTLLEITIAVVVIGVVSAAAIPSLQDALQARRRDGVGDRVQAMVSNARDVARTRLQCVTVAPIEPCDGEIGLATYSHSCPAGSDPALVDANANLIPDAADGATDVELIERFVMDPETVAMVQVLQPGPSCIPVVGTAKLPKDCYEFRNWFQYRADGTTTQPFHIKVVLDASGNIPAKEYVIQPGSGSVRVAD